MTTFLFWNLNRKPLHRLVANLANRYGIDIVMLVESHNISSQILLSHLNSHNEVGYYNVLSPIRGRVEIYSRLPKDSITSLYDEDRLTIRRVSLPEIGSILLAVAHLPSKLYWSEASQTMGVVRIADAIRKTEDQVGHLRTILVGDLNMNPFEDGVVSAYGLHSIASRQIVATRVRQVEGKEYPYFYNPMWNLFGDDTPGPPGTYYYSNPEPRTFFWNIFDQVLIRPDLLPYFHFEDLQVLISDGVDNLLAQRGIPDVERASDHLPILFRLRP